LVRDPAYRCASVATRIIRTEVPRVLEQLTDRFSAAAELLAEAASDVLAFTALPAFLRSGSPMPAF
jgi:hypothetical protein